MIPNIPDIAVRTVESAPPHAGTMKSQKTVAGIDIGGEAKGNHLVIMQGTRIVWNNPGRETPEQMLEKCIEFDVAAVGIDAPCQWRIEETGRQAEKMLARMRISCFVTPTRERASQSRFYDWMFNGESVYKVFVERFPLLNDVFAIGNRVCFETFPHAITCALRGREATSAKAKNIQRRETLERAGVETRPLRNIDEVDAALCALTANFLLEGWVDVYGDSAGGFIVVPSSTASSGNK
ncbi:hypothetical protein PAMC26510_13775 [Caballeronia sordidicola]|uniref:DUF429 domain-containing protein n=2 Tax=Burkholderiales TaxID=80840 RepID=A0A242MVU6_CABSO|nr:hypothetical protein PAMC26510_13775 [Caballeronia sordidicola]